MSVQIYASNHTTQKYNLPAAQAANLHQSLNGECTFDLTMPGRMIKNVAVGDEVRLGDLYFDVTRLAKNGQPTSVSFGVSCEHISYVLTDMEMPEGEYYGSVTEILDTILSGSGLSAGTVEVSGYHLIQVKSGTSRRQAMLQWATICGAEISYYQRSINFLSRVGSAVAVSLSDKENVKSLSVTMDSRSDTQSYSVELSRLRNLSLGDAVTISYSSLNLTVTSRVISLDYDPFHPMEISMTCGAYIPTYYEAVQGSIDDMEEEITDELEGMIDEAIANAMYADVGDIAELTVDRLSTSRRVRKYILSDTSDDNYIQIQDNQLQLITGVVKSSSLLATEASDVLASENEEAIETEGTPSGAVQATNRWGQPLYWQHEPVGHTAQGYPTDANGNQIYATTDQTNWPVWIYDYTDLVKAEYSFKLIGGVYTPQIILGAGDENGRSKGYIYKTVDNMLLRYITSSGKNTDIRLANDGYVEIDSLRRAIQMNFSNFNSGYFTEILDGGIGVTYAVEFDTNGNPKRIYDGNHECQIIW